MPLSNFTRPSIPYDNAPLPNDSRFKIITRTLKKPITSDQLDGEFNKLTDNDNILDNKIEAVQAGILTGSDNPLNAGKLPTTDGKPNPTISWVKVTNDNIDDGDIDGKKITPLTISTEQLDNGIITPDKVPDGSMPYSKMDFNDEDIPYVIINIPDGAIAYPKLNIPDGAIPYPKLNIPNGAIPGPKLANKSITQAQQGLLSVGTPELIDQSVTLSKVAPNVLTSNAATKNDQITADSHMVYTNPAVQQFHPSAAKFWCIFDGTLTGTNPPKAGYNVNSVTRIALGIYNISYIIPFENSNYCLNVTSNYTSSFPMIGTINNITTSFCQIQISSYVGTFYDSEVICVQGFGLQ